MLHTRCKTRLKYTVFTCTYRLCQSVLYPDAAWRGARRELVFTSLRNILGTSIIGDSINSDHGDVRNHQHVVIEGAGASDP